MKRLFKLIIVAIILIIIGAIGYLAITFEKPTVIGKQIALMEVPNPEAETIPTTLKFEVSIKVHNPNAFGITVNRLRYELSTIGRKELFLGEGLRTEEVYLSPKADTTINTVLTIEDTSLIASLLQLAVDGEITLKAKGYVEIKLLLPIKISFEEKQVIEIPISIKSIKEDILNRIKDSDMSTNTDEQDSVDTDRDFLPDRPRLFD